VKKLATGINALIQETGIREQNINVLKIAERKETALR